MALEDCEKTLAQNKEVPKQGNGDTRTDEQRKRRKHHHHHHHHNHPSKRHPPEPIDEDQHRRKRSRHSVDGNGESREQHERKHRHADYRVSPDVAKEGEEEDEWVGKGSNAAERMRDGNNQRQGSPGRLKRDSWMEAPTALHIDYTQMGVRKPPEPTASKSLRPDFELKIHTNELNKHHLQNLADGKDMEGTVDEPPQHKVDYTFGDSGAQWRMTKLRAVHREAEESGRAVDDI
ncbi:MAG: hypothetical protein M1830_005669, partial [Pleopsidium flavum]